MSEILKVLNKSVELKSEVVELAIRDKFVKKLKSLKNHPQKFAAQLDKMKADVIKGINEHGDLQDEVKKVYQGLNSLGLKDEANNMKSILNDVKNDFDELVFIKELIDKA